jgi:hypothetical protein
MLLQVWKGDGGMPRVAIIQDGTEVARQTEADITGCFEACSELLSRDGNDYDIRLFQDEAAGALLEVITVEDFDCVVFASNALNSGTIERAGERRGEQLRSFLERGGGMVILHQVTPSLSFLLPEDLCPVLADRGSARASSSTSADDSDDVLLHFPMDVSLGQFVDGGFDYGPPSLFYRVLDRKTLPSKLKQVLLYGDELLVARSYDHVKERVVIAALPLDWQRATSLLANALRFACRGLPLRLVWEEETPNPPRLMTHWLSLDGTSSIRPLPATREKISAPERWLMSHVDVLLVPGKSLETVRDWPEIDHFVRKGGGTLISTDDVTRESGGQPLSRVTAVVGGYAERRLASRLYAELRAVRGWDQADHAFELRNIVAALGFLATNQANLTEAHVGTNELSHLVPDLRKRLANPRHREDLSSSIAHAQTLAVLSQPHGVSRDAVAWMASDRRCERFDVSLQVGAVTTVALGQSDREFLKELGEGLDSDVSLAALVRALEALSLLDQAGHLTGDPDVFLDVTEKVCSHLERHTIQSGLGWLSVEATADIAQGLIALLRHLSPEEREVTRRAMKLLGDSVVVLKQAFPREVKDRNGVAHLARLIHTIVLVDRHYPIGVQRLASIPWPDTTIDSSVVRSGEESLLNRMTIENKRLREREIELTDSQRAAQVGRGFVTVAGTALVVAPLVYLLYLIGFASPWTLVGNIAILLSVVLAIFAGLFSLLDRWHLLANPAVRVRNWLSRIAPLLTDLSKMRPRSG